jgi:hypothetical protein
MDNAQVPPLAARRAAVADAAALTRLREAMLSDMEMLAAGFATQMIQTPSRQPVRADHPTAQSKLCVNQLRARQPRDERDSLCP